MPFVAKRKRAPWLPSLLAAAGMFIVTIFAAACAVGGLVFFFTTIGVREPTLLAIFWVLVIVAFALSAPLAFALARYVYDRVRWKTVVGNVPTCLHCHYNLTGNTSGRCPECGAAFPAELRPQ